MKDAITCNIIEQLRSRFERLPSQCSREQPMFDAQGREYLVVYTTIPTSLDGKKGAIASNLASFETNKEYLEEFQARDLSSLGEMQKIRKIARNLDPTRLLVASGDPTIGAPVVWRSPENKHYVLGGNGRTIALLIAPQERYEEYIQEAKQRWSSMYDSSPKRGYRNILVREVFNIDGEPLSLSEAIKLAGASQESTAGKETPLRQALSRARGMGITQKTNIGLITEPMPLNPYTIEKFIKKNIDFWRRVKALLPDYIRSQMNNLDDKTLPIAYDVVISVLVGRYLPTRFIQQGFEDSKEEEAIIGVLPSLVTLQQGIDQGSIYPEYDLMTKLETARDFMKKYRFKTYGDALRDYKEKCELQTSFLEPSPVCRMNKLGVAFGLYLKRMVQASDPTKGVSDINKYIDKAFDDSPQQIGMFGGDPPEEIEKRATNLFISLALPKKLGSDLMKQNPQNTDDIIIQALMTRFSTLQDESKPEVKTQRTIKPYRVAPQFVDVIFDHDDGGTIIEFYSRLDRDTYKSFVSKLGHRSWKKSYGEDGLRPSPKAKRANAGEPHPQNWFINKWASGARFLLQDGKQVFVYEAIDPRLDDSYLLETEKDLDALIDHMNTLISEERKEKEGQAEASKEIIISQDFPVCRYMKAIVKPDKYAKTAREARQLSTTVGSFLLEQNEPHTLINSLSRFFDLREIKDDDRPKIDVRNTSVFLEGKRDPKNKLSAPYYAKLISAYYTGIGYDVTRTAFAAGKFLTFLEQEPDMTESGYDSRDIRPILYVPFPTKEDLIYFSESNVQKWINLAQKEKSKIHNKYTLYADNDFSLPISSFVSLGIHDDGEISYLYVFEVLGIFRAMVLNVKGKVEAFQGVFRRYIDNQSVLRMAALYPSEVTTDPEDMERIDNALEACKKVSKEYIKEKTAPKPKGKKKALEYSSEPATAQSQRIFDYFKKTYEKDLKAYIASLFWKDKKKVKVTLKRPKSYVKDTQYEKVIIKLPTYTYESYYEKVIRRIKVRDITFRYFIFTNSYRQILGQNYNKLQKPKSIYFGAGRGNHVDKIDDWINTYSSHEELDDRDFFKAVPQLIADLPIEETARSFYNFIKQYLKEVAEYQTWQAVKEDFPEETQ